MAADRPYGEFYGFYSVSPENLGSTHVCVSNSQPTIRMQLAVLCFAAQDPICLFLKRNQKYTVLGCVHTNRVESSPIQSSQTLESRGVHTDRVESSQVSASPSGFLVLFEQCTSKEL